MSFKNSIRRWAAWGGKIALLTASGCATSAPATRSPAIPDPLLGPALSQQADASNRPPRKVAKSKPRGTSPSPTRSPTANASYASRTQGPGLDLQHSVIKFTRQPSELINPPTPVRTWQYIVLHHSGEQNGGYASIDKFHRGPERGWDECGYHFVIGNGSESGDGEIEVGSRWLKQKHGAHTHPPGHTEYNDDGLGICLIGDCNQAPPTPKQVEACRRLVAYLQARCSVPANGIITHGDADGAKTDCPGKYFPYDRLTPRSGFASR